MDPLAPARWIATFAVIAGEAVLGARSIFSLLVDPSMSRSGTCCSSGACVGAGVVLGGLDPFEQAVTVTIEATTMPASVILSICPLGPLDT
jgi:hypothetical protein